MNDLNQMYVSYLIERKLRRHEDPFNDQITSFLNSRHSSDGTPSFIHRILEPLRRPSSRRRHQVVIPTTTRATGTGGVS